MRRMLKISAPEAVQGRTVEPRVWKTYARRINADGESFQISFEPVDGLIHTMPGVVVCKFDDGRLVSGRIVESDGGPGECLGITLSPYADTYVPQSAANERSS